MRQLRIIKWIILIIVLFCGTVNSEQDNDLIETIIQDTSLSKTPPNEIQINIDTLDISINGRLRKVALFNNRFYLMFETDRENTTQSFKKMIVIDKNGDFIEDVFIPGAIQDMIHYDILTENDSLFINHSNSA
jgi:hypothetical protein